MTTAIAPSELFGSCDDCVDIVVGLECYGCLTTVLTVVSLAMERVS